MLRLRKKNSARKKHHVDAAFHSTGFVVVSLIAIFVLAMGLIQAIFDSGPRYKLTTGNLRPNDSKEFLDTLEALTDSKTQHQTHVEVLTNSDQYYAAELDAIRHAEHSINFEAYIFQKGDVASEFLAALTERAQAGVQVNMVLDAVGSVGTFKSELKKLRDAHGKFAWYHPLWWNTWISFNNRTHREIIVVDGKTAFIGGSGFADHWLKQTGSDPRWRDTMVKVQGDAVDRIQSVFAENWLESTGEVIAGEMYFPFVDAKEDTRALVVASSPGAGGSTRARILFQFLIDSARHSIHITTPYFLPDKSATEALQRAARRGVDVRILVPGKHSDHFLSRRSSRRRYGPLLRAGAHIWEYTPSMIHAKIMTIDGLWSVVGSTNFDSRSFRLNDEVNLAVADERLYDRLEQDFARDLSQSREVTLQQWQNRSILDRVNEYLGWVLERQE